MRIKIIVTFLLAILLSSSFGPDAAARGRRHYSHRYGWHRHHRIIRVFRHERVTRHREYDTDFHGHHRGGHRRVHAHHHYNYYKED